VFVKTNYCFRQVFL